MAKRKISAATRARLKALRRKHGLGEFKNKARTVSVKKRSFNVARRRKTRTSRRSNAVNAIMKVAIGGFVYGVARTPINNFTKGFLGGVSDELGMLLVDAVIANFTTGQIRNAALIGVGIETATLAKNFNLGGTTPILGVLTTQTTSRTTTQFPGFVD